MEDFSVKTLNKALDHANFAIQQACLEFTQQMIKENLYYSGNFERSETLRFTCLLSDLLAPKVRTIL